MPCQPKSMGLHKQGLIDPSAAGRALLCWGSGSCPAIPVVLGTAALPELMENPMSS